MRASFILLCGLFLSLGCSQTTTEQLVENPAQTSTPNDAATLETQEYVIDVRSAEEWDTGHVEQAVNIPHTEIGDRISEVTSDKDAKIVLYCKMGGRAGKAKETLEGLGFTNIENAGGYDEIKERFATPE